MFQNSTLTGAESALSESGEGVRGLSFSFMCFEGREDMSDVCCVGFEVVCGGYDVVFGC